jgi:hypothetical protein
VIVECFFLVELVVYGGIAHFLVVDGGKGNYPNFIYLFFKLFLNNDDPKIS